MLQFSEEYFKSETRSGFAVSEVMKRCWAAQLDIMHEIDALCKRHNITYYAFYGTLLGTIRHEGFIPWDDDVDFAFKRDDYIRFLEYAQKELPENLILQNIYTHDEWENACSRIVNEIGMNPSDEFVDRWYGCPFSAGVDLFPLYGIPRDAAEAEMHKKLLASIGTVGGVIEYQNGRTGSEPDYQEVNTTIAENLVQLEQLTGYHFDTDRPIQKQLDILYDQLGRLYGEEESDYLAFMPKYIEKGVKYDKRWFQSALQRPFENISLTVPDGYDAILTQMYKNYMNPWKGSAAHDYPYFKEDLQRIGQTAETMDLMSKLGVKGDLNFSLRKDAEALSEEELKGCIPSEWFVRITGSSGTGRRKILFYYTGAKALVSNAQWAVNKIKWVIDTVAADDRYVLWWFPCSLDLEELGLIKKMMPDFVSQYQELIDEYKRNNTGICDESGNLERAIAASDIFYGDEGVVQSMFTQVGKPVMIQNYRIRAV